MKLEKPFRTGCLLVFGALTGLLLFFILVTLLPALL